MGLTLSFVQGHEMWGMLFCLNIFFVKQIVSMNVYVSYLKEKKNPSIKYTLCAFWQILSLYNNIMYDTKRFILLFSNLTFFFCENENHCDIMWYYVIKCDIMFFLQMFAFHVILPQTSWSFYFFGREGLSIK